MGVQIVTNAQLGNFLFDGAFIQEVSTEQGLPVGPASGRIGVSGSAPWGKPNTPIPFSVQSDLYAAFGNKTTNVKSLVREALSAMPECSDFVGVRVTDGTDVAGTIAILDTATPTPATVLTLTAVCSGSLANGASARVDLQSGTLGANPIFQITIFWPIGSPQVFSNIVGYAGGGGAYSGASFKANALAAINGTAPNSIASPYFVATTGASSVNVLTATVFNGSGGTDGDTGVTAATEVGTDLQAASTGMYCMRGMLAGGQIVIAGLTDATQFGAVAAFAQQEQCFGWIAIAQGQTTAQAIASKAANNLNSDFMSVVMDWDKVFDPYQATTALVSPIGKAAGIVASQPAWKYVGNKPGNGCIGVISTDRLQLGALSNAEAGQRESNGILWLGKTQNSVLGLPHGLASSGKQISDTRMLNYIAFSVGSILSRYVGEMLQTTVPIAQADENDPRIRAQSALHSFFEPMVAPGQRQISAYNPVINDANNPTVNLQRGFLVAGVQVTTLTGVRFAVGMVQVGNTVNIATTPLSAGS